MKVVMMRFIVIGIAIMASMISVVSAQTITAMPLLFGRQANNDLYNCDGLSKFFSPQTLGTCYTGGNGYIGCCTVESCVERTTCVPFTDVARSACDEDTGGCKNCRNSNAPNCVTIRNVVEDQFIMYCDVGPPQDVTTSYTNPRKTPASTPATTTTSSSQPRTSTSSASGTDSSTTESDAETTGPSTTNHHGDSTPTPTFTPAEEEEDDGKPASFFVAIVLGVVLGSTALFIAGWFIWRGHKKNRIDSSTQLTGGPAPHDHDKDDSPMSPGIIQYNNAEINDYGPQTPAKDDVDGGGSGTDAGGKWTNGRGSTKLAKGSPPGSGLSTALGSPTTVGIRELDGADIPHGNAAYEMDAYGRPAKTPVGELSDDQNLPIHREEILAAIARAEAIDGKHLSRTSLMSGGSAAMSTPASVGQNAMSGPGHKPTHSGSGKWLTTVDDHGVPTIGMALPGSSLVSPTSGYARNPTPSSTQTVRNCTPKPLDFNKHSFTTNSFNVHRNSDGVSEPNTASTSQFSNFVVTPEPNLGSFPSPEIWNSTHSTPRYSQTIVPATTYSRDTLSTTTYSKETLGSGKFDDNDISVMSVDSQTVMDPAKWPSPPKTTVAKGMSATGWGTSPGGGGYVSPEIALRDGLNGGRRSTSDESGILPYQPFRPSA